MIAWSHLSQSQCYFQKELGGVPNSDIYEHHMEYQNILMDVVRAIHSEAKSPFISSEDSFMLFSSPEYCLTFKAELTPCAAIHTYIAAIHIKKTTSNNKDDQNKLD